MSETRLKLGNFVSADKLTHGRVAVVTVRGMGGIGKTQLALEYAHQQRQTGRYRLTWWIRAESELTLTTDLAAMAPALGIKSDTDQERTIAAVLTELRQREAAAVRDRLPSGDGHTLITSRDPAWGGVARHVDLATFTRPEAVQYLQQRTSRDEPAAAEQLAAALGDLPLALAQAAAYLERHGGLSIQVYLTLYHGEERAARMLVADLDDYPHSVASTWLVHFRELQQHRPAALQLLRLCAFLDPDDINLSLLLSHPEALAGPLTGLLADAAQDPTRREEVIGTLARTSLVSRIDGANRVRIHRLVAEVTRVQLGQHQSRRRIWRHRISTVDRAAWADHAAGIIDILFPDNPDEPGTWPTCAALAAHASIAVGHATIRHTSAALMHKLGQYLYNRVELVTAASALTRAVNIFSGVYGADHANVADVLTKLGTLQQQRDRFDQADTSLRRALDIYTAAYGPDHASVAYVLTELGTLQQRRDQFDQADTSLRRALDIYTDVYGSDNTSVAKVSAQLDELQRQHHAC